MVIQNKMFPDGEIVIYVDYERSEHAGADGCFQVSDISIEGDVNESIQDRIAIDQGKHHHSLDEVLSDLVVAINDVDVRVERFL